MLATALVFLFLVGTVASAIQAMKWLERRQRMTNRRDKRPPTDRSDL